MRTHRPDPVAYAREFAERAPLLALPGVDLAHFDESITLLETAASRLAEAQDTDAERLDVARALYPLSFLRAALGLEEARRAFLVSGAADDLRTYDQAQRSVLAALRRDLSAFERAFRRQVPGSDGRHVVADKYVDRDALLTAFAAMRREIAKTEREMLVRRLCAIGLTGCAIPPLPADVPQGEEAGNEDALIGRARRVRSLTADIFEQPEILREPIIVTEGSDCFRPGEPGAFFLYDEHMPEEYPNARRTALASDMRFLRTERFPQVPLYRLLAKRGVEFVLASPLLHYACMDLGADLGRVSAIRAVRDTALASPLSGAASQGARTELSRLEAALAGDIVREADARSYLDAARALAARGELTPVASTDVSELILGLALGTPGLPDALILFAKTELLDADANRRGIPSDLSAENLFFSRSGFELTFMTHNPSIFQTSPFALERAHVPESREPYAYLSKLPDTPAMRRTLIEDAHEFVALLGHPFD